MSKRTALLGIMDPDTFKSRTKSTNAVGGFMSKFKCRGGELIAVDMALDRWFDNCDNSHLNAKSKYHHVEDVADQCSKWFARKARTQNNSLLSNARGLVVAEVLRACPTALAYLSNKMKSERPGVMAGIPATYSRGATKGLEPGFAHERTQYKRLGKQSNPYSASAIVEEQADRDVPNFDVATLDYAGFVAAGDEGKRDDLIGDGSINRVEFMNRSERLKNMVVIRNGLFYQNGALMKSDIVRHKELIIGGNVSAAPSAQVYSCTYAVDRYGNVFSKKSGGASLRLNHSSYCAGKQVLCAGTMAWHEGRLLYISNMSGHYKPNAKALEQVLRIFAEEGVDIGEVLVETLDTKQTVDGLTFLRSPGVKERWIHYLEGDRPAVRIGVELALVNNPT